MKHAIFLLSLFDYSSTWNGTLTSVFGAVDEECMVLNLMYSESRTCSANSDIRKNEMDTCSLRPFLDSCTTYQ
jgi:hypothetical protein